MMMKMIVNSLAETEGDLEAPGEVDGAIECLQRLHAVLSLTLADVAVRQHRHQRSSALSVLVAKP